MEVEQGPETVGKVGELMGLKHFQTLLNGIDKDKRMHVTPLQALYVVNRAIEAEELVKKLQNEIDKFSEKHELMQCELAALREENDQLKAQVKHEVDKVKSGCEYWRRRCLDAEAQVAGLQELYKNSIGIIEKTLLDGSIGYMELQKQIDAYTAYALSPDPGEKYRKVIEAAIQKVEADKKDIPFNKWTIFSDELTQAVEALKEGD